jgi:hypothetical protein
MAPKAMKVRKSMKNAERRNRLPPLAEEDRRITLYLWHVTRGHPDISTISIANDASIGALRRAICSQEGYTNPVTLKSDNEELTDDSRRIIEYELYDGDIVRIVEGSVASSSAA